MLVVFISFVFFFFSCENDDDDEQSMFYCCNVMAWPHGFYLPGSGTTQISSWMMMKNIQTSKHQTYIYTLQLVNTHNLNC